MDILETIVGAEGGGAVKQIAAQFGIQPEDARSAVAAMMPALAAGLQRNMGTDSGLSSLLSALERGGHDAYLDDPATLSRPAATADGNGILGHVFGNKDVSRQVAARASQQTGIDTGILKKMLPLVAALAMGGLSRRSKAARAATAQELAAMLAPLLQRDRDGSMVADVAGMLGGVLGGRRRE